ncbi:MAG: hypothetical protein LBR64_06380 [Dysgonamonadaceae bacterium]|jgi:hypothetical protein|nr:hypothetical protein [Dysgonamonadaceae bacterium]
MKYGKLMVNLRIIALLTIWAAIPSAAATMHQEAFAGRFFVSDGAGVFIESGTRMNVDGESLVWGGGGGESENKTVRLKGFKSGDRKVRIVKAFSGNELPAGCLLSVKPASGAGNRDSWLRSHEKACTCHHIRKFYAAADWQQNHYSLALARSVEKITYSFSVRFCCRGRHLGREPTVVREERL